MLRRGGFTKDYIIDNKLIGLYSLLPLMEIEEYETDEEIIEKSVRVIETIEDELLRGDSLAAMSIMSAGRYSSDLIEKYVRREMLMNSPLYDKWMEEEREESRFKGRLEGEIANSKKSIRNILFNRFEVTDVEINEKLNKLDDIVILENLFNKAMGVETIDEFRKFLGK